MSTNPHPYICECTNRKCRERIVLRPAHYRELRSYGVVVSPLCTEGRRVIAREPGVRVVASAMGVLADV